MAIIFICAWGLIATFKVLHKKRVLKISSSNHFFSISLNYVFFYWNLNISLLKILDCSKPRLISEVRVNSWIFYFLLTLWELHTWYIFIHTLHLSLTTPICTPVPYNLMLYQIFYIATIFCILIIFELFLLFWVFPYVIEASKSPTSASKALGL